MLRIRNIAISLNENYNFISDNGEIKKTICIYGDNLSGKTKLLNCISEIFIANIKGENTKLSFDYKDLNIEFEYNSNIFSSTVVNGTIKTHPLLSKQGNYNLLSISKKINNFLLFYPSNRNWQYYVVNKNNDFSGISNIFSVINDIVKNDIRDSVILIDDIDSGLSQDNCLKFINNIKANLLAKNNQLIFTTRNIAVYENLTKLSDSLCLELPKSNLDILSSTIEIIKNKQN